MEIKKPPTAAPGPGTPDWVTRRIKTWHGIDGPLYGANDFDKFIRTYHETILSVDDSVGEIYDTLRSIGELDNTIFLFAGDNGFLLGEHASIDKRTMWEESIRIPLLVRFPEGIREAESSIGWSSTWTSRRASSISAEHRRCRTSTARPSDRSRRVATVRGGRRGCTSTTSRRSSRTRPTCAAYEPTSGATCTIRTGRRCPTRRKQSCNNIKTDPLQKNNLIDAPEAHDKLAELKTELQKIQRETGGLPDKMPVSPELRFEMPDTALR